MIKYTYVRYKQTYTGVLTEKEVVTHLEKEIVSMLEKREMTNITLIK